MAAQPAPHVPGSTVPQTGRSALIPGMRASTFWAVKQLLATADAAGTDAARTTARTTAVQLLVAELNAVSGRLQPAAVRYHPTPDPDTPARRASTSGEGSQVAVDLYPPACRDIATLWVTLNHEYVHVRQRHFPELFLGEPLPDAPRSDTLSAYREFSAFLHTLDNRASLGLSLPELAFALKEADHHWHLMGAAEQDAAREAWDSVRVPVAQEVIDRRPHAYLDNARFRTADEIRDSVSGKDQWWNDIIDELLPDFPPDVIRWSQPAGSQPAGSQPAALAGTGGPAQPPADDGLSSPGQGLTAAAYPEVAATFDVPPDDGLDQPPDDLEPPPGWHR